MLLIPIRHFVQPDKLSDRGNEKALSLCTKRFNNPVGMLATTSGLLSCDYWTNWRIPTKSAGLFIDSGASNSGWWASNWTSTVTLITGHSHCVLDHQGNYNASLPMYPGLRSCTTWYNSKLYCTFEILTFRQTSLEPSTSWHLGFLRRCIKQAFNARWNAKSVG